MVSTIVAEKRSNEIANPNALNVKAAVLCEAIDELEQFISKNISYTGWIAHTNEFRYLLKLRDEWAKSFIEAYGLI